MINQIYGSNLVWIDFEEYQKLDAGYDPFLKREAERVKKMEKNHM